MSGPPPWRDEALCREYDPEMFFPVSAAQAAAAPAIAVCQLCPVMVQCADWAVREREANGVWGGLSERHRARLIGPARRRSRVGRPPRA